MSLITQHIADLEPDKWGFDAQDIFHEERERLEQALCSDSDSFLELLPGKVFFPFAARSLGIERDAYRELVSSALIAKEGSGLTSLREKLEDILSNVLPPRQTEGPG